MNYAFDMGGVITTHPERFRSFINKLASTELTPRPVGRPMNNHEHAVFIISDMPREKIIALLLLNNFQVPVENIYSADHKQYGNACKAVLLKELKIDVFFDDSLSYVAASDCPIRLLVMPDATRPYMADTWKSLPEDNFDWGRERYHPGIPEKPVELIEISHTAEDIAIRQTFIDAIARVNTDPGRHAKLVAAQQNALVRPFAWGEIAGAFDRTSAEIMAKARERRIMLLEKLLLEACEIGDYVGGSGEGLTNHALGVIQMQLEEFRCALQQDGLRDLVRES